MTNVKTIKKKIVDSDLASMFNSMLGDGDADIIAEKLKKIRSSAKTIATVTRDLSEGPMRIDYPEYSSWCDEFLKLAEQTETLIEMPYMQVKTHDYTRQLVMICENLVKHSHYFVAGAKLEDRWIGSYPGLSYCPFNFTKLDLKHIWGNARVGPRLKLVILTTLSIMFHRCHEIYTQVSSPDIDVKKFSQIIINSIDKVKGIPELSRCNDAFNKIRESVNLLESNFPSYYKEMELSKNPNFLIESFVIDVSQGQGMNIKLMKQFRKIINFYSKQSGQIKDPKIKKVFDTLNTRMDQIEKKVNDSEPDAI